MGQSKLYKSKLCRLHIIGQCRFGMRCFFAHGADEIKDNRLSIGSFGQVPSPELSLDKLLDGSNTDVFESLGCD
eukprot:10172622-Karenia_brevis.AAC.1